VLVEVVLLLALSVESRMDCRTSNATQRRGSIHSVGEDRTVETLAKELVEVLRKLCRDKRRDGEAEDTLIKAKSEYRSTMERVDGWFRVVRG